ncbi:MAG: hypothetical protein MUF49_14270 [Oculatellaceae cyanobacterium Prado106]|jgi:hypothetical protein|nr:hypothetical protein [Oculatellaceae cyanobacterium Prado106]
MKNLVPLSSSSRSGANRLLTIWAGRYLPDTSLFLQSDHISTADLTAASSLQGRTATAQKLKRHVYFYAKLAWLRTSELLSEDPNVANLAEIRFLAQFLSDVFETILEVYTWPQPPIPLIKSFEFNATTGSRSPAKGAVLTQDLPAIEQLAKTFHPVLEQLQQQHLLAKNPDILGFTTTQFHFSTEELLKRITPAERILLSPYFQFTEEQICIPWQQVCTAAYRYRSDSKILHLAELILEHSGAIAHSVFQRILKHYPAYASRRGKLSLPAVQASVTRDIVMFLGYLVLCLLEDSMTSVEQKLLPLCQTVFPRVAVSEVLVKDSLQFIVQEVQDRFPQEDLKFFLQYADKLQALFATLRKN